MRNISALFLTINVLLFVFCINAIKAEVTVDPIGLAVYLEEEGELSTEITLTNHGDEEVAFEIDLDIREDEDNRIGPRRDDLGDEIDNFECHVAGGQYKNGAWDPDHEWFWIQQYSNPYTLAAFDANDDFEEVERFNTGNNPMDLAYYDGVIYVMWLWNPRVYMWDTEGENIDILDLQGHNGINGIAIDREQELFFAVTGPGNPHVLYVYTLEGEQLGEIGNIDEHVNNVLFRSIEWVPEHRDGPLWVSAQNHAYQVGVNTDGDPGDWELTEQLARFETGNANEYGVIAHDGENIWISNHNNSTITGFDDGIIEFRGLIPEPEEGVIDSDDVQVITLNFTTEGLEEPGTIDLLLIVELDDPAQPMIVISTVMTVDAPAADLTGAVTDTETDEVVEGVTINMDRYIITRFTDEEGFYAFENLPSGEYELAFTVPDYLPSIESIDIEDNEDLELNVALLHADCTPSRNEFFMELEPDMGHEFDFEITNGGNGPLTYTSERRLLGEANAEPWELREAENIEDVVQDDMLNGVVFAAGHFFVAGGNNGDDVSKIYKINTDGELVDEFDQFNESRYGMRDLAYDGELIWGADGGILYGFTTEGELESTLESPVDIECRSIAWDPDNQVLITSDITTDIYAIDLEGDLVETFERPQELRIYGLGFWPDDPDGYDLYVFCRGDTTDLQVNKFNLEDSDYMVVAELGVDGGRPGGVQITNQLDVYSWVFITIVQNPDRLAIWQLEARKEWFQVEPVEGVIEAEESEEFILTLDATGLPSENTFEGEVVFSHDGVGAETVLSVRLDVVEGEIHTTRNIEMEIGWNLVSTNLQPDDEENIRGLMAALVEEELLVLMKNSDGEFYRPDYDYNNIPGWYVNEGYQMLVSGDCVLTLEGMSVLRDRAIPLEQGWQIASYYPRFPVDAIVALSGIVDHLIIAKDGRGNFYLPDWDFSNMGDMCEGQGYYLNVDEDIELVYQTGEEANALSGGVRHSSVYDTPGSLPVHAVTGENMSLLVIESAPPAERGVDIGIYAGGQLVGSGVLQDGICGIAVWGDDPMTEEIDGALEGQPLEVRLLIDNGLHSVSYVVLSGKTVYRTDSFAAIRLNEISELPSEFGIISAYPNPFNARTRIVYGLPEAARIDLAVYDLSGRRVYELASGRQETGIYAVIFDGSGFASGVYMVRLEAGSSKSQWKVALVK